MELLTLAYWIAQEYGKFCCVFTFSLSWYNWESIMKYTDVLRKQIDRYAMADISE